MQEDQMIDEMTNLKLLNIGMSFRNTITRLEKRQKGE
jgi:hypothetical protein